MPNTLNERGFTLVELMITVALLAIVATIAVPNFTQFIRNNQVQAQSDELLKFLQYARGQAVANKRVYEVNLEKWQVGPEGAAAERTLQLSDKITLSKSTVTGNKVTFNPMGIASKTASFVLCNNGEFSNGYLVEIKNSGSVHRYARGYKDDSSKLSSCTAGG
ncbi:MAG: prepilin-type N-terminal cleavage/methylation domain-containing protein [Gammaproteobacteria bacterium]|nr:prepilin-type N-terminal cleavage/methylation domain-containing protein [Gammaproteobacteria bacterium]